MSEVSEKAMMEVINDSREGCQKIFDGFWQLKKAQSMYHGGIGAALPVNLSDIAGSSHSAAHMTKEDIDASLMWFGEEFARWLEGDGNIQAIVGGVETPVQAKPGQMGNILRGIR